MIIGLIILLVLLVAYVVGFIPAILCGAGVLCASHIDKKSGSYDPAHIKNDGDMYYTKLHGKSMWLVAQKLTDSNIRFWRHYAKEQTNSGAVNLANSVNKHFNVDGSMHFDMVLSTVFPHADTYICYVTNVRPKRIEDIAMESYNPIQTNYSDRTHYASNILMFVTANTHAESLLAAHMGISSSIESILEGVRGLSVDLHSFAAKVLLISNPKIIYMITCPSHIMESIIIKNMPSNVHIGTRELQAVIDSRAETTPRMFNTMFPEIAVQTHTRLLDRASRELENAKENGRASYIADAQRDHDILVKNGVNDARVAKIVRQKYDQWYEPKTFEYFGNYKSMAELMAEHPPVLSVADNEGMSFGNRLTILDTSGAELCTATPENIEYRWLFARAFEAAGSTHYLAVDYGDLAEAGQIIDV